MTIRTNEIRSDTEVYMKALEQAISLGLLSNRQAVALVQKALKRDLEILMHKTLYEEVQHVYSEWPVTFTDTR